MNWPSRTGGWHEHPKTPRPHPASGERRHPRRRRIHTRQLYADEYRFIHIIGPLFLLQASTSLALAALAGFTASRTVGVFGFTEHGLQPTPQALLSLLTETGTLLLLAIWQMTVTRQHRAARTPVRTLVWDRATLRTPPS